MRHARALDRFFLLFALALVGCGGDETPKPNIKVVGGSTTGGTRNTTCNAGTSSGEVQKPEYKKTLSGQTSWFAGPVVRDLDGDGILSVLDSGNLVILAADGALLHDIPLHNTGEQNGNENGAPAAPAIGDLDG